MTYVEGFGTVVSGFRSKGRVLAAQFQNRVWVLGFRGGVFGCALQPEPAAIVRKKGLRRSQLQSSRAGLATLSFAMIRSSIIIDYFL